MRDENGSLRLKRFATSPWFLAYALSFGVMLLSYVIYGVYPFGDGYVLRIDAVESYAPRVAEFYRRLQNGESLFYSVRGGLGIDFYFATMVGMMDPLLWLGVLFDESNLTEIFALLHLLEIPFCAATFAYFLNEKYKAPTLLTIALSMGYGLCSFLIAFLFVHYWTLSVAMLPLIALGIDRLLDNRRSWLYSVALGVGIACNFLMGLFLCIGSAIYFFYEAISRKVRLFRDRSFWRYVLGSVLGVALSGFSLIVCATAMSNTGYNNLGEDSPQLTVFFALPQMIVPMLFGHNWTFEAFNDTAPAYIYSGFYTLLLCALFFSNGKIALRRKLAGAAVLFVLFCAVSVSWLSYAIHGFRWPAQIPHRFSFVFSLFTLSMAMEAFLKIRFLKKPVLIAVFVGLALFLLMLYRRYTTPFGELTAGYMDTRIFLLNLALLAIYSLLLYFAFFSKAQARGRGVLAMILCALFIAESSYSAVQNMEAQIGQGRSQYIVQMQADMDALTEKLNAEEVFYRAQTVPPRTVSDGFMFGFVGMSVFSEGVNGGFRDQSGRYGFTSGGNAMEYALGYPFYNSLFGLRYSIHRGYMNDAPPLYFQYAYDQGALRVYENPYALPLAFLTTDDLRSFSMDEMAGREVQNQNRLASAMSGLTAPISSEPLMPVETLSDGLSIALLEDGRSFTYAPEGNLLERTRLVVSQSFIIDQTGAYSVAVEGLDRLDTTNVSVNGVLISTGKLSSGYIGQLEAGTRLTVEAGMDVRMTDVLRVNRSRRGILFLLGFIPERYEKENRAISGSGAINVFRTEESALSATYEALSPRSMSVETFSDTFIEGSLNDAQGGSLFFTLPYDARWHVYIDGVEQPTYQALGAFLSVDVAPGAHQVQLFYRPKYVGFSIAISAAALLLIILIYRGKDRFFHEKS
ncbi:MAG: YfhO family protein [Oscillospiraceae bacterium]|nr:YfhO family protein [Oscillospiraceae bacterium]